MRIALCQGLPRTADPEAVRAHGPAGTVPVPARAYGSQALLASVDRTGTESGST